MAQSETSVIVRAFNEEKYLPGLLEGLKSQSYRDFETIVVDSGSFDRTPEIAESAGARLVRIESRDFTFGYSLNTGIERSRGRYLAIVSAHTKPADRFWLEKLVAPLQSDRVAMVYGRQVGWSTSKFAEVQDFRRTFGARPQTMRVSHVFGNNANSAFRKDLWEQFPFDETLPGLEDVAWATYWLERGIDVLYQPEAAIHHIHEESWRQVWHRYYREAVAAHRIGIKGRKSIPAEVAREAAHLLSDLTVAVRQRSLYKHAREIVLFRAFKGLGTVRGLWDGGIVEDPRRREEVYFDKSCKAVVIRSAGNIGLENVEVPPTKPGDVLIKVAYVGICGTDLELANGTLGYYRSGMGEYPITPGHEFSGRVVRVGANVHGVREGDRVVGECILSCGHCDACQHGNPIGCAERREVGVLRKNGACGEYVAMPGHAVHRIPEDLDLLTAALCEPTAVVLKGLRRLRVTWTTEARHCLVLGGGPIGIIAARALQVDGHEVLVVEQSERRRDQIAQRVPQLRTVPKVDDFVTFDTYIEATGDPDVLDMVLRESRAGSNILLLGFPYAHRAFNFEEVVAFEKAIVGSVGSGPRDFEEALELLPRLELQGLTVARHPLGSFEAAWNDAKERRWLKVILEADPGLEEGEAVAAEGERDGAVNRVATTGGV